MNLEDLKPEHRAALVEALDNGYRKIRECDPWLFELGLTHQVDDDLNVYLTAAGRLFAELLKKNSEFEGAAIEALAALACAGLFNLPEKFDAEIERAANRLGQLADKESGLWESQLESAQSPNQWQPIETAPKDGTEIDLWVVSREFGGRRFADCFWGKPHHICGEMGSYCDSCPDRDDWVEQITGYITGESDDFDEKVTHWRPVPSVPEAK